MSHPHYVGPKTKKEWDTGFHGDPSAQPPSHSPRETALTGTTYILNKSELNELPTLC